MTGLGIRQLKKQFIETDIWHIGGCTKTYIYRCANSCDIGLDFPISSLKSYDWLTE